MKRLVFDALLLVAANGIYALSVVLFLEPARLAPGGVIGVAIIIGEFVDIPTGILLVTLSVPLFLVGYWLLDRWRVVFGSLISLVLFTGLIELFRLVLPSGGVSDDQILNAVFAGLVGGFGMGLIFRTGATSGGTTILTRILQQRFGVPMSSGVFYIDGTVILAAGTFLGWEAALYSVITILIYGAVQDYALEGPSVIRTVTVVTDQPEAVAKAVNTDLQRGVTAWEARGMYTGRPHHVLFITILRSQVDAVRRLVFAIDPSAYVVIGMGHRSYRSPENQMPLPDNLVHAAPTDEQGQLIT